MHRLALGCLALALAQGCIIIDDTDENGGGDVACPAREDGGCFAVSAACPPDAVNLNVFTQPVGVMGVFPDEFTCAAGGAEHRITLGCRGLDPEVVGAGIDHDGAAAFLGQEVADLADIPLAFEFPTGQGIFKLEWSLEMDGSPITCEDIGAATIEVESTLSGAGTSATDSLPCTHGVWQTRPLDLGTYDVTVTLLDDSEVVLGTTADPIAGELAVDSELVALPAVTFEVAAAAR